MGGVEVSASRETRVLGVVGSPRRDGNTETLVDAVLEGAFSKGVTTEKVVLAELEIAPCRACSGCQETGDCVQKDDMQTLIPLMRESDFWVLGTPIYWWGPTSQFKTFVDRWYGVDPRVFRGKYIVATIPMGGKNEQYSRHVVGMLEDISNYLGMEFYASIIAPGMNGKGVVRESKRHLDQARDLGAKIAGELLGVNQSVSKAADQSANG
jgi:multimeric flavodoxin WrbA